MHPHRPSGPSIPHKVGMRLRNGQVVDDGRLSDDLMGGEAPFRSDFDFGGTIDLADVGLFAERIGEECP